MRARFLIALVLVLGSTSCTVHNGSQAINDQTITSQLKPGTTKAEVKALLGEPLEVRFPTPSSENWIYEAVDVKLSGWLFIPFAAGITGGGEQDARTLTILFGPDGRVKKLARGQVTVGDRGLIGATN